MACGVGMLALGLGLYAKHRRCRRWRCARPARCRRRLPRRLHPLRPVRARLPLQHPELAKPATPVATGTPYFTARNIPCEMCEDIPCVKACPTGALDHALTDINKAKMGLAVLIDQETCLNFLGLRCDVCYRVCPVIDKAITLDMVPNPRTGRHAMLLPTVHSEHCTGCGKCEKSCVLEDTDPFVALQSLAAGHVPETLGLIGVAIVLAFYLLVGGRVYCSWVCPINVVTDAGRLAA
jgi:ferredoxin-type protein NapG